MIGHFTSLHSQKLPEYNAVFNDLVVSRIDITIDPDSLRSLLLPSNVEKDHEYPANFVWDNGVKKDTVKKY